MYDNMYRSLAKCATPYLHHECVIAQLCGNSLFRIFVLNCTCGEHFIHASADLFFCSLSPSAPRLLQQPWLIAGARYACWRKSQRMLALTPVVTTSSRRPRSDLRFLLYLMRVQRKKANPWNGWKFDKRAS